MGWKFIGRNKAGYLFWENKSGGSISGVNVIKKEGDWSVIIIDEGKEWVSRFNDKAKAIRFARAYMREHPKG